jgi:hypothetical protein
MFSGVSSTDFTSALQIAECFADTSRKQKKQSFARSTNVQHHAFGCSWSDNLARKKLRKIAEKEKLMTPMTPAIALPDNTNLFPSWGEVKSFITELFYGTPPTPAEERWDRERKMEERRKFRRDEAKLQGKRACVVYGGAVDAPDRARDVDIGFWGIPEPEAKALGATWAAENGFNHLRVETHELLHDPCRPGSLGFRAYSLAQRSENLIGEEVVEPVLEGGSFQGVA